MWCSQTDDHRYWDSVWEKHFKQFTEDRIFYAGHKDAETCKQNDGNRYEISRQEFHDRMPGKEYARE